MLSQYNNRRKRSTSSVSRTFQYIASQPDGTNMQPIIQAAVDAASTNTMIVLPAGNYIVNDKVTITSKFISFMGSGTLETVLSRSESLSDATLTGLSEMFFYNTGDRSSSNIIVENIYFKSQVPEVVDADGGSLANDSAITLTKCVDFKIKNCRFDYFGNGAVQVKHYDDLARGLITGCTFYWNAKGFDGNGLGYGVVCYGENLSWMDYAEFGTNNFVFIENCTFDYHRHSIAAGGCGRYVARYNTIRNNIINDTASLHAIDAHEARGVVGLNYYSTRAIEAYNNTIQNTKYYSTTAGGGTTIVLPIPDVRNMAECAIRVRGGESVTHSNTISGYRFGFGMLTNYTPWGTTYPLPYCPGYNEGTDTELGCFHYDNTFTAYDDAAHRTSHDFHDYGQTWYQVNRDWHLNPKANYSPYVYPHPLT